MSLEEFRKIDASKLPIGHFISMIFRGHTTYLNHKLSDLDINASQLHFLFEINYNDEINQERIASRCNINKGAVARSIKKLEEKELIVREIDNKNRRQNKVSLTKKGEETLKSSIKIIDDWEREVLKENDLIDEELLKNYLKEIAIKTIELNREL